jgi:formylglycine-generating enzyme required for sulfatase activity
MAASVFLLFFGLSTYVEPFLSWESVVSWGFRHSYQNEVSIWSYLGRCFLWDDGLISSGDKSLIYGALTYALFHFTGFTIWALRLVSVASALLSVVVIYHLGRRFFGETVGIAAAVLLVSNVNFFFHARYGTSPSATMLALLCALYCTWNLLVSGRPAWWHGLLAGSALCLATYNYAPGRLVVMALAAVTLFWALLKRREMRGPRAVALLLAAFMLAGLWGWQKLTGHAEAFLRGKGEQYLYVLQSGGNVKGFLRDGNDKYLVTSDEKVKFAGNVLKTTLPEYLWFFTPRCRMPRPGEALVNHSSYEFPPVPLYFGPLALFIIWGAASSLRRLNDARHFSLLAWMPLCTLPLLFTSHVDAHRTMIFVIPLTIWAALGVGEAARVMESAGVPPWTRHLMAVLAAFSLLQNTVQYCYLPAGSHEEQRTTIPDSVKTSPLSQKTTDPVPAGAIVNERDGSVLLRVPAGEFWMGKPDVDRDGEENETPYHKVYLDAYYIGRCEVTNAQFARFVKTTGYRAGGNWKKNYNSSLGEHPVAGVSWNDAVAYCKWAGLRLPTEAEWEKAARGTKWRKYPWGNEYYGSGRHNGDPGGTTPVGSFPDGSSPYGCLDMAGNVWEWCADWYDGSYYYSSPVYDPRGAEFGSERILRGGSWFILPPYLFRTSFRLMYLPGMWDCFNGFRVARSAEFHAVPGGGNGHEPGGGSQ